MFILKLYINRENIWLVWFTIRHKSIINRAIVWQTFLNVRSRRMRDVKSFFRPQVSVCLSFCYQNLSWDLSLSESCLSAITCDCHHAYSPNAYQPSSLILKVLSVLVRFVIFLITQFFPLSKPPSLSSSQPSTFISVIFILIFWLICFLACFTPCL